jgi:hypothetical protein
MKTKLWKLDRKIDSYYIRKSQHIWEAVEFGKNKNLDNLFGSHKPIYVDWNSDQVLIT